MNQSEPQLVWIALCGFHGPYDKTVNERCPVCEKVKRNMGYGPQEAIERLKVGDRRLKAGESADGK